MNLRAKERKDRKALGAEEPTTKQVVAIVLACFIFLAAIVTYALIIVNKYEAPSNACRNEVLYWFEYDNHNPDVFVIAVECNELAPNHIMEIGTLKSFERLKIYEFKLHVLNDNDEVIWIETWYALIFYKKHFLFDVATFIDELEVVSPGEWHS